MLCWITVYYILTILCCVTFSKGIPCHHFLAHLMSMQVSFCYCPLSVVHRPSVRRCVRQHFDLNISSETADWFLLNFTWMIPVWFPPNVVQTVPDGCISWLRGQKRILKNAIFKNNLVLTTRPRSFIRIWYITSSRGTLTNLYPWSFKF